MTPDAAERRALAVERVLATLATYGEWATVAPPFAARDVLSLADALRAAEARAVAAEASATRSADAAVDAARELGHVASAAVARADAADARSANLLMCAEAAERSAEEAHSRHAALAAAVREERAAADADNAAAFVAAEARLDALLRGAPAGVVPVGVVRAYLDALDLGPADAYDEDAATERTQTARAALDAAIAAAGCV